MTVLSETEVKVLSYLLKKPTNNNEKEIDLDVSSKELGLNVEKLIEIFESLREKKIIDIIQYSRGETALDSFLQKLDNLYIDVVLNKLDIKEFEELLKTLIDTQAVILEDPRLVFALKIMPKPPSSIVKEKGLEVLRSDTFASLEKLEKLYKIGKDLKESVFNKLKTLYNNELYDKLDKLFTLFYYLNWRISKYQELEKQIEEQIEFEKAKAEIDEKAIENEKLYKLETYLKERKTGILSTLYVVYPDLFIFSEELDEKDPEVKKILNNIKELEEKLELISARILIEGELTELLKEKERTSKALEKLKQDLEKYKKKIIKVDKTKISYEHVEKFENRISELSKKNMLTSENLEIVKKISNMEREILTAIGKL